MMEKTSFEEIETSSKIESKKEAESITELNSIFYEKNGNLVDTDSKIYEDFCAVQERIKYEKIEGTEDIETCHTESATLSENCEIPKSEQSLEFSRIISEFTDYTPLTSLCRLCATRSDSMVYMFSQNDLQNDIIVKIEFCLPIEVKKTDTLPKEVCHLCLQKLELCYEFHKSVKAAEKQFLTFVDGQCHEAKYKSSFDLNTHSNIVESRTILQELPKLDTETLENSTILSNSMLQKETYCTNRTNEESKTESSRDEDQSTCNSLLTGPLQILNNIEETSRIELYSSTSESHFSLINYRHRNSNNPKEEPRNDKSNDNIVVRKDTFNKRTSAEQNIIGHELIKCQNCRETFETVNQCLAHSSIHASKGYFLRTRKNCNKHSLEHKEDENLRKRGVQTNRSNKSLKEAKFKAKIKVNNRLSSKNELHCKKCNKYIDSETSLHQHMLTVHKQQKKSSHNTCERKSSALEQLIAIQRKLDRRFECKLCNRRFPSNDILEVHKKTNCSGRLVSTKKKYLCTYCNRRFRQKGNFNVHLRTHTGERPYDCDLCCKTFNTKEKRNSHRRVHTGERPYKCSKCDKKFTTSTGLQLHSLVHLDAKPYSCHLCHLSFKRLYHRNIHLGTHTVERPYNCDLCDKRFKIKSRRDTHRRIHIGEHPYKCDLCGKIFSSKNTKESHRRMHTGERPYKCDICGTCYTKNSYLLRQKNQVMFQDIDCWKSNVTYKR